MILGSDIGYSHTKNFFWSPQRNGAKVFRTAITSSIPRSTFGERRLTYEINGERFIVGDDAQREGKLVNVRRKNFVGSNAYLAVLLSSMHLTVGRPETLVLGLPPGQFTREYCTEVTEIIRQAKMINPDGDAVAAPDVIKLIPQGGGIYFSHVLASSAGDYKRRVVVLDIGYYTLDMLFFDRGKYVEGAARSYPHGIHQIYEGVKKAFTQEHKGYLKSDESVEALMTSGSVEVAGAVYKMATQHLVEEYNAQVNAALEEYVESLPGEADIVLGGGGGVNHIRTPGKYTITIVNNAQSANAIGYCEYGKRHSKDAAA